MSSERNGLGFAIRGLREQRGWSVGELADRAGLPAATIYNLESQNSMLHVDVAMKLCQALDVELTDVVEGNITLPPVALPPADIGNLFDLLENMPELNDDNRRFITGYAVEAIKQNRKQRKKKS